jgi:transposase
MTVKMSLRGVPRGFGLKVGRTTPRTFPGRIRELVADHPTLSMVGEALLAARSTLFEQCQKLESAFDHWHARTAACGG